MSKRVKLNTIRIIAGQWRGLRLDVPDLGGLRPTTDRVRETLFNWLTPHLAGARCLDLFAGSGALGIESLSRGASFVQCVESNALAANSILKSATRLTGDSACLEFKVTQADALIILSKAPSNPFDIVFLDPPFQLPVLELVMELLVKNNWLSNNAMIYVEQSSTLAPPDAPTSWAVHRQGKAGQSEYFLYRTM